MRNLKKLTAILLVSAMCIGTAFTSFAAEGDGGSQNGNGGTENTTPTPNPGTPEDTNEGAGKGLEEVPQLYWAQAADKDGNRVHIISEQITDKKALEVLTDEDEMKKVLGQKYNVGKDDKVTVLTAANLKIDGEMPEGGVDMMLYVGDDDQIKPGNTVYVLHKKADGTWEVFSAKVNAAGEIEVHFDSLSPVAVVKVTSDGKVKVLTEKGDTTRKSPKTGE